MQNIDIFLIWLPKVFWWSLFGAALLLYAFRNRAVERRLRFLNFKLLVVSAICFRVIYALLLTLGQYTTWASNKFTQTLIESPLAENVPGTVVTWLFPKAFQSELGYFLFYSYGRFWLNLFIVITVSISFWFFLRVLKRHNERFFEEGEPELGLLASVIAGWPGFILFVPIAFLSIVLVSMVRGALLKEMYTTLGYPLLLASAISLFFSPQLIEILGLTVFKI